MAVIATISVGLSKQMFSANGTLNDISFKAVFLASMGNLTLLFLLKQVGAMASSLSAGGINVSMPGSANTLRHAAQAARLGARASSKEGVPPSMLARLLVDGQRTNLIRSGKQAKL
ncbi:hypothetical protein MRX60_13380 (plasmid) [Xylella fastidiosa subsp. pauca]|uniref:hypothetical protein n=1 Tax=Xylella fastidiosa TaxID=2371 RepID=UPI00241FB603|nr:hypothetical protein [Xylella fastidiosa]MDG5827011.1 hypothetical protein [Xylella fastidiosa subsp. pauca]